jgi:lysophospholipase L1-like esterase
MAKTKTQGMKTWWKRLALAGFSLAVMLLLAEGAVRWLGLGPDVCRITTRWFRLSALPGVPYEFRPGVPYGRDVINRDSMRDRPRAVEKTPGRHRVACIGDSICAGLSVASTQIFSRVWEDLARDAGRDVEILNFGVPGYNLDHILAALRGRTLKYRPDRVVYLFCLNDVQDESYELEALLDRLSPAQRSRWKQARRAGAAWLSRSRLANLARYGMLGRKEARLTRPPSRPQDDPQFVAILRGDGAAYFDTLYDHASRTRLRRQLREFGALARQQGFDPVLVLLPSPERSGGAQVDPLLDWVADTARDEGLRVADTRAAFRQAGVESLFADPLHPNAAGHRLIAEVLHAELDPPPAADD